MAILRRATTAGTTAADPYVASASGYTRRVPMADPNSRLQERIAQLETRVARLELRPQCSLVSGALWDPLTIGGRPSAPDGSMAFDASRGNLWMRLSDDWYVIATGII